MDLIRIGTHANLHRYMIKNHKITVKCFKDQDAEKERDALL